MAGKITASVSGGHVLTFSTGIGSQFSAKLTSNTGVTTDWVDGYGYRWSKIGHHSCKPRQQREHSQLHGDNGAEPRYDCRRNNRSRQPYTSMAMLATAIQTGLTTAFTVGPNNVNVEVYDTNKLRFFTYDEGSDYKLQHNSTGSRVSRR